MCIRDWERGEKSASEGDQGGEGELPFSPQCIDQDGPFIVGFSDPEQEGLSSLDKKEEHQDGTEQGYDNEPVLL
jgi:hypothetical protein